MGSRVRHSGRKEHSLVLSSWGWEVGGENGARESKTGQEINDLWDYIINPRNYYYYY
jgi:hypothetical protein